MQGPGLSPGAFALRWSHIGCQHHTTIARPLSPGPQQPSALPLPAALLLGLALVVQLLAAGERKLEFGAALVVEIELERHQRHSLALDRADELVDLAAVQEELAQALGGVVEAAALQVFRDVGVDQPDLAVTRIGIGFRDGRLAAAQRFDLCAGEREPDLEGLADLVVEARLAIVGDHANFAVRFRGHPCLLVAASCPPAGRHRKARTGAPSPDSGPRPRCQSAARRNRTSAAAAAIYLPAAGVTSSTCRRMAS